MNRATLLHFAENLRLECERFESIAYVCRGLGINRQQFNKYLAGNNLPNAKMRRRICDFLGVPEVEMFTTPVERESVRKNIAHLRSSFDTSAHNLRAIAEAARASLPKNMGQTGLRDGYYFCYFPLQNNDEMLVRSLLKIKTERGLASFTRHTLFRSSFTPSKVIARGRHRGLIIPGDNESYLLGINLSPPQHLSLLSIPRVPDSMDHVYRGLGVTRGISETYSCRLCLEYLGREFSDIRAKVRLVGVVRRTDQSIHPSVAAALSPLLPSMPGQLNLPVIENLIFAAMPALAPRRAAKTKTR